MIDFATARLLVLLLLWHISFVQSQSFSIQSCFDTQSTNVKTVASSDSTFKNASQPFNLRTKPSPNIIVYPSTAEDVSKAIGCAANSGLTVSARSGGHSYAGYGLSGDVVVDLSNMKNITVDESGIAVVQTGNLLGELAEGLWNNGQRALPHGTCPYVGTGGHPLYGGFGLYSRTAGLLLDHIQAAEVVLANGSIVTASNNSNPNLFWALRGGGASFGIVTAWTFNTLPAPETTVTYQIDFPTETLTANVASEIFMKWQNFAITAPNELSMAAVLAPNGQGGMLLSLEGTYYGSEDDLRSLLTPIFSNLPLKSTITSKAFGWLDGLVAVAGKSLSTKQPEEPNTFYAKSVVTTKPLPEASVTSWINYLFSVGLSSNLTWFSQADLYGGAISSVAADDMAFAHRDAFLVFQFYANTPNKDPPFPSAGLSFLDDMVAALDSKPTGAYPNYIDPRLPPDQWPTLYFGQHVERLEEVKSEVDPKNIFKFQQGISPSSNAVSSGGSAEGPKGSNGNSSSDINASHSSWAYSHGHLMLFYCISGLLWLLWTIWSC